MEEKNEKKKVLFVITKGNFGGAQKYVFDLATNLPKTDFDTVVACGTKEGTSLVEKLEQEKIRVIKIDSSEREINLKNDFRTIKEITKIIREEKPNIIHLNSSKISLLGSLSILFLKFSSIIHNTYPIPHSVFTVHGWAFNEKQRSAIFKIMAYLGHYFTILICDTTIAVSQKAKTDVCFMPFVQDKIKVIYNGISDFDLLPKKEAENFLLNSKITGSKEVIFSISELHKNKGVDVAIKAISLLPEEARKKIFYVVAGDGEERKNLEKMISELGLENNVKLLGFVPDAKKFLSGCDIFLLPSRTEAFPYVILEAGFAGLPIISTSVGGIPEVLRDMQNGILIHPRNPKEIAEAILYLLDHPEKQKEFGSEIKKTISNFFSLEKMLSETLKIYGLKID